MDDYFAQLNGEDPGDIYAMVISEVERPLLACVLEHCGGNQTRAASLLGLNRATLRKKLRTHDLI
jgi:Fis family transcriptional regulator